MNTQQINAHDVKPGDVILNQGYAFKVAETYFQMQPIGNGMADSPEVEVFRYRVSECLNDPKLPATYAKDAVYGHRSDILVTIMVQ